MMLSISACLRIRFALSCRPAPLLRATIAIAPVLSERNRVDMRNLGWVDRPTAVVAQEPSEPTMIWSAMLVSCVSISSMKEGQAMLMTSP